jgi:hypothetical protein
MNLIIYQHISLVKVTQLVTVLAAPPQKKHQSDLKTLEKRINTNQKQLLQPNELHVSPNTAVPRAAVIGPLNLIRNFTYTGKFQM